MDTTADGKVGIGPGLLSISKSRAFLIHLTASAVIVGTLCAIIFFIWYPAPYFSTNGAWGVLRILVGVDLILGPTLTLVLFKPNKPWLLLDVSVIAVIQLAALIYGATVIYQERPYYAVFAVDRFEVLAYTDVDSSMIQYEELRHKPLIGPILAVANRPENQVEFQRLLEETLFEGKPDIERRAEYWSPYESGSAQVIERSRPLTELRDSTADASAKVLSFVDAIDLSIEQLAFVPVTGKEDAFVFVIDTNTAAPIDIIEINPWNIQPSEP
jgi:hypothetical protein